MSIPHFYILLKGKSHELSSFSCGKNFLLKGNAITSCAPTDRYRYNIFLFRFKAFLTCTPALFVTSDTNMAGNEECVRASQLDEQHHPPLPHPEPQGVGEGGSRIIYQCARAGNIFRTVKKIRQLLIKVYFYQLLLTLYCTAKHILCSIKRFSKISSMKKIKITNFFVKR